MSKGRSRGTVFPAPAFRGTRAEKDLARFLKEVEEEEAAEKENARKSTFWPKAIGSVLAFFFGR